MLKNKNEITDYNEKSSFLKKHGWVTWYHVDNWLRKSQMNEKGIVIDRAGRSTNSAYKIALQETKPEGLKTVLYFAYGSNMSNRLLMTRGVTFYKAVAYTLRNVKLHFNKRLNQGSAAANIMYTFGYEVQGVMYEIPATDIEKLDKFEGFPVHYTRKLFKENNIEFYVYIANLKYIDNNLLPTKEYIKFLTDGKEYLSDAYYKNICNTKTLN